MKKERCVRKKSYLCMFKLYNMKKLIASFVLMLAGAAAWAQGGSPDPNFYIYLCFGQSNMEG